MDTLILILLIRFLNRISRDKQLTLSFGSRRFRVYAVIGLSLLITVVSALAWLAVQRNKQEILAEVGSAGFAQLKYERTFAGRFHMVRGTAPTSRVPDDEDVRAPLQQRSPARTSALSGAAASPCTPTPVVI